MENNQRNSRKRLNSLILLVAFTAVMLIVSTYAWFSTQRNVTFNNIKGKINVAEGLQVSLDGQTWVNSIDFNDFNQEDSTWPLKTGASSNYFASGVANASLKYPLGSAETSITNTIPGELLPVSTDGQVPESATKTTGIAMYKGNLEGNNTLKGIAAVAESATEPGYFAFDIYLMNTSGDSTENDPLHLDTTSKVTAENGDAGAQNAARVGFALYANDGASGANVAGTVTGTAGVDSMNGSAVRGATDGVLSQIAIWEPNVDKHTTAIVGKFNNRLIKTVAKTSPVTPATYFTVKNGTTGDVDDPHTPTFALTAASVGVDITNIYDWDATDGANKTTLKEQKALKTKDGTVAANTALVSAADGSTPIEIGPNQYHRMRVYIWLEGQDVDCLNEASFAKNLNVTVGINKPESGS